MTHTFGDGVGIAGGSVGADVLKSTRQRTDDDWAAAVASLQSRGWIDDAGAPTELGLERRRWIEDTNRRTLGRSVRGDRRGPVRSPARDSVAPGARR